MNNVTKVMIKSIVVNVTLFFIKLITGIISYAPSLIADSVHSLSDMITDVIAIIGIKLSNKKQDLKYPYGYGKYEYVTSIVIAIFIICVGIGIVFNTHQVNNIDSVLVIMISFITLIIKFLFVVYLFIKGKMYNNAILLASAKESFMGVISTLVVLINGILICLNENFIIMDLITTIIIGFLIMVVGVNILKENIGYILDKRVTDEELIYKVTRIVLKNNNIKGINNIVLLKYGYYYKCDFNLIVDDNIIFKDIFNFEEIVSDLKNLNIKYLGMTFNN